MSATLELLIERVESAGGRFLIDGDKLGIVPATAAEPVIEELRQHKAELITELARRLALPQGVKLVRWKPLPSPVQVNRCTTVTNTQRFIETTLRQLGKRLTGDDWGAGNWSCTELVMRLEAVGCVVELEDGRRLLQ
jgi:hypothetical protein